MRLPVAALQSPRGNLQCSSRPFQPVGLVLHSAKALCSSVNLELSHPRLLEPLRSMTLQTGQSPDSLRQCKLTVASSGQQPACATAIVCGAYCSRILSHRISMHTTIIFNWPGYASFLYLQRLIGGVWPSVLAALCRCPLAPLASLKAANSLALDRLSVPAGVLEVWTGCRGLPLQHLQQMLQRPPVGQRWARQPERAQTGTVAGHPDQAQPWAARAPGPGSGRRARWAAARSAPVTCGRQGLRRDCWMEWAGWRECPGSSPGLPA